MKRSMDKQPRPAPLPRTDLALEARERLEGEGADLSALPGVKSRQVKRRGLVTTTVEILDREGAKALDKPVGTYITLELEPLTGQTPQARRRVTETLAGTLAELLALPREAAVLVVGLGNPGVTPDAVGPRTLERLLVTRHLRQELPEAFRGLRSVSALQPGVLGQTGLESAEIVRAVAEKLHPDRILVIDALAALRPERLCATVQLTDTGITPGSGVGNHRAALTRETLGAPVYALGVPTVCDRRSEEGEELMLIPRNIGPRVDRLAGLLSESLNLALHPGLTREQILRLTDDL